MLNLRNLRNERGLFQKDVAIALNCTASCISSWEKGITEPNLNDLIKLSKFFGCSIDYLLGIEDEDGTIKPHFEVTSTQKSEVQEMFDKLSFIGQSRVLGYMDALLKEERGNTSSSAGTKNARLA